MDEHGNTRPIPTNVPMPLRVYVLRRMRSDAWVYYAYEQPLTFEDTTAYIRELEHRNLQAELARVQEERREAITEAEEYGRALDRAQNERDAAITRAEGWEREALRYAQNSGHWQEKYEELRKSLPGMVSAEGLLRYARRVWLAYGVRMLSPAFQMKLLNRARKVGYRPLKNSEYQIDSEEPHG